PRAAAELGPAGVGALHPGRPRAGAAEPAAAAGAARPAGRDAAAAMTTAAAAPILEVEGVHKSFGGLRAVAGASFAIASGSITARIGPNGAGKTTLFDLITGFGAPDRGLVRFEGRRIAGLPPHRIARRGLVRTFQLTRVFAAMTVLDNMMLAAP